jgi:hypothetical protein
MSGEDHWIMFYDLPVATPRAACGHQGDIKTIGPSGDGRLGTPIQPAPLLIPSHVRSGRSGRRSAADIVADAFLETINREIATRNQTKPAPPTIDV